MKKFFSAVLIGIVLLASAACAGKTAPATGSESYATVNGETITVSEMEYFKKRDRSDIINEFSSKYGITDFSDFWDRDFDGVTPAEALENRAFEDAVTAKIKLVLMLKEGIYEDIGYEALKNLAEQYNDSHKNQSGTVGILSIDMDNFYTYYISTGEMELKNRLAEGILKPSQDEIDAYLSENSNATEEGAVSYLVRGRYEAYIQTLVSEAETEKTT